MNMAARVCAAAAPGEVLVTGTVRGITRASIDVGFASRGKQRLKDERAGRAFAVTHGASTTPRRRSVDRRWLAAIGLGAVAVMALAFVALAPPGLTAPKATATPEPTAQPLAVGPPALGTYAAQDFHPPFSFTIDDPGWSVYRVYPDGLGLQYGGHEGRLDVANIPLIYGDPCGGDIASVPTGTSIDDLVEALKSVWFLHPSEQTATEIGGNYAESTDIAVDPVRPGSVRWVRRRRRAHLPSGGRRLARPDRGTIQLQAVDVDATTISFLMSGETAPNQSPPALEQFFERAERIVQSVEF